MTTSMIVASRGDLGTARPKRATEGLAHAAGKRLTQQVRDEIKATTSGKLKSFTCAGHVLRGSGTLTQCHELTDVHRQRGKLIRLAPQLCSAVRWPMLPGSVVS